MKDIFCFSILSKDSNKIALIQVKKSYDQTYNQMVITFKNGHNSVNPSLNSAIRARNNNNNVKIYLKVLENSHNLPQSYDQMVTTWS